MKFFNIKALIVCVLSFIGIESQAATVYQIENAVYLECNTCSTTTEFKNFGVQHFKDNYSADVNKFYAYTIVNESSQLAVFIDIKHKYQSDPESGTTIDVYIPYLLTSDGEMADDYLISQYAIRGNTSNQSSKMMIFSTSEPKVVEVTIDSSIGEMEYTGVGSVAGLISQQLNSHVTLSSGWHKLVGRAVSIVNFNDGKLASFFQQLGGTLMYSYLQGTAVDLDGNPVPVDSIGSSPSAGGSGGLTSSGSGSWTVFSSGGGGVMACTSIDGGTPVCKWIRF